MKSSFVRYSYVFRRCILFIAGTLLLISFFSCSSVKKVHEGEYLLSGNRIIYRLSPPKKTKGLNTITNFGKEGIEKLEISSQIAPSEILPYVKQKPNTKILFVLPFYLYLYNVPDSAKTARVKARKDTAYAVKARKKGWTQKKLKRKIERKTGREWIMSQGEAPVILDTSLTSKSTEQVKTFLITKGYFNAAVKDSIHIKGKKAIVSYIINPGKPYRIHKVEYFFEDPTLAAEIYSDTADCKIKRNEIYDEDLINAEKDRLTLQLNNAGYYYFSKQYVGCILDTNSKTHLVDITINIKKFAQRDKKNKDSVIETNHVLYHIRHVTVQMNYDPTATIYHADDTIHYEGLTIVYPYGKLTVKPAIFKPKIFITPGDVYRISNRDDTYTGLSQLNEFNNVSIKYVPIEDSNYIDCYIQLMPVVKHSIGAEFEVTNTGGDGGVQGDISYENYNQFKGAEKLLLKLNGGLIAQKVLSSSSGNINKYIPLNTINLGPELDLTVPRPLFPFSLFKFARKANPQTTIKLSYNYQQEPDYSRHILGLSYALDYDPVKNQHFTIALLEVNLVNAALSPDFAQLLQQYNLFFQNSFKNQFITDSRVSWTLNTQQASGSQTQFNYLKLNIENSGFDFFAFEHLGLLKLPIDQSGSFSIFGLPSFSQYIKGDVEWRHYFIQGRKQKYVIRFLAGVGLPYDNSSELPFTKSFWAGGSNDIRAWQLQTLGPGGSPPSTSAVAGQVGDIKLEGNWEYRVSIIKYIELAWFIDAGNIWLIRSKANEGIPLAYMGIGPNPFWSEIAVGTGPGLRLNFTYFVVRFDIGQPVRDPSLPPLHRMIPLHDYSIKRTVFNFGIGYPF